MIDDLTKKDWYLFGVGAILGLVAAALTQMGILTKEFELILTLLMVLPIIPGLYFLYKARSLWGGDIARYLDFIGIGLALNLVIFPLHMAWHFGFFGGRNVVLLGLSPNFWYIFFHGLSGYSFAMLAYGFYLFYQSGAE